MACIWRKQYNDCHNIFMIFSMNLQMELKIPLIYRVISGETRKPGANMFHQKRNS